MALSYVEYQGDGVTQDYVFSFEGQDAGYFDPSHISVLVDGEEIVYTLLSSNTLRTTFIPASGSTVRIQRTVPNDVPYADFSRGNNFGQEVMNRSFLQQLYLMHQILDGRYPEGYTVETDVRYTGGTIFEGEVNLPNSDPSNPEGAVSYEQADGRYVNSTGDTMTGPLTVPTATQPGHAARLEQVTDENRSIRQEFRAADDKERAARAAADANLQAQLTGEVPLEASAFSPISWHDQSIDNAVSIPPGVNAWSFGPEVELDPGGDVTIGEGSFWTIADGVKKYPDGYSDENGVIRTQEAWASRQLQSFATLTDVFSDTALRVGALIQTAGYEAALDGGANRYLCVPTGTAPADGGRFLDHPNSPVQLKGIFPSGISVLQFGAKGDGVSDDTAAIKAALATGLSVHAPKPTDRYIISELLYPSSDGQRFTGDGVDQTIIQNTTNDQPLFCFGNPEDPEGAVQWAYIDGIHFRGNESGSTLWGVFCPNAPTTNSGVYEGVSSDAGNYYAGNGLLTFADWNRAARGNQVGKIRVSEVDGGYAMHVSAWGFGVDEAQLFSGARGLRNCGAANSNHYGDLYVSTMSKEGIIHPDSPSSVPTATTYGNIIVQQCGVDDDGFGSIVFRKGQGTKVENVYLERNDELGSDTDIFVGVSEVGCTIDSIRHRTENGAPEQTIVETQGQGVSIGAVVYAEDIGYAVHVTGSDTRTETFVRGPIMSVGASSTYGEFVDDSSNKRTTTTLGEDLAGFSLNGFNKFFRDGSKTAVRQGGSTSNHLSLESRGSIVFSADYTGSTTGGDFIWEHNGEDGNGDRLLFLDSSNGHFSPGTDGAQNFGLPNSKWNTLYAVNDTVNTSDETLKTPIEQLNAAELRVAAKVKELVGKYKWKDRANARWHFGVGAQSVKVAFEEEGLDGFEYGCLCYDEWEEGGKVVGRYGVRPSELLFFIISAM